MFIRNKNQRIEDYTDNVKSVYKLLRGKYGYTLRISSFWKLLTDSLGISEFELIDFRDIPNGEFENFLIEFQLKWMRGEDVDFSDIKDKVLEIGDFTRTEKELIIDGDIEERIWAIYLSICNPELENVFN